MKTIIFTENAPAPIGPYSQAVSFGNLTFISGQIALDPKTGELVGGDIQSETRQVMKNLDALLQKAGLTFKNVLKATIFITDMGNFPQINEVYGSYFSSDYPARETVEVSKLPKNVNVEISVIAASF